MEQGNCKETLLLLVRQGLWTAETLSMTDCLPVPLVTGARWHRVSISFFPREALPEKKEGEKATP